MASHRTAPAAPAVPATPTAREIELNSPWMRRLALALVGSADAADDVVQDAWARLAGAPTERGTHVGYLVGLVRSLAHGRRRGDARRRSREAHTARVDALPSTAEVAARVEVARRLAEALEQLDEPYRTTLVLRYFDELSAAEIARRANIPAGTVRARAKRGLDLLRARLDDGNGGRASWMSALLPLLPAHPRSFAVGATTTSSTLAASALLTMKLTLGATLCALAAFLAWTFAGRQSAGERALDASAGDGVALVAPELTDVAGSARRRPTVLAGTQPDTTLASDTETESAAARSQRATAVARATTRDGRPIQGAWLRVAFAEHHEARAELDGRLELTLELGLLERLASVSAQRSIEFRIGAEGFSSGSVSADLVAGSDQLVLGDVVLRPGGSVHGRVVEESGLGIEGALVVFGGLRTGPHDAAAQYTRHGPHDLSPVSWSNLSPALSSRSGPGGSFRLDGVPVGYGIAWARTATSLWAVKTSIGVRAGEDVGGIELVVIDAHDAVISGRVVDPDGRAVPGVEVGFPGSLEDSKVDRTDKEGRFHYVTSNGRAQSITVLSPTTEWDHVKRTGVKPGTHDLELAFERARWHHIEVVDHEGRPIANGKALGLPATGPTKNPLHRCEAPLDHAGRARLIRLDCALRVRVEAPGYRDALVGPFAPSTFPASLVVKLAPVRALVGRIQLPDGRRAAGARVSLHQSAAGPVTTETAQASHLTHPGWSGDRDAFVYALQAAPTAVVRADDEGRFRLPLPGVDARAPEESDAKIESSSGELNARGSASRLLATVDPLQPWFVHAALDGYATITSGPHVFDPARDVTLDLELPLGGAIAGRLVLTGVGSAHGWTARASDGLAEVARAAVAEDGTFRFEHLHVGPWQVRVFEPGRRFPPAARTRTDRVPVPDLHVVAGETVVYEHRVEPIESALLAGQLSIDGAPPGALVVTANSTNTKGEVTARKTTTLDPDGRFEVTLQPGLETLLTFNGY